MYEYLEKLQPVILAGGDDSRMGSSKALAPFEDRTLIENIYTLLDYSFERSPLVVTNDRHNFDGIDALQDATIVEDVYPGHKVLGAVASAFDYTDAENIFAIGVNMPFICLPLINKMAFHIQMADAVVPIQDGKDICLHAVYNRRLVPIMHKKIEAGEVLLHSFFPEIDLVQIQVRKDLHEDVIFCDIHTPADLKLVEEQYEAMKNIDAPMFEALKQKH